MSRSFEEVMLLTVMLPTTRGLANPSESGTQHPVL